MDARMPPLDSTEPRVTTRPGRMSTRGSARGSCRATGPVRRQATPGLGTSNHTTLPVLSRVAPQRLANLLTR